MATRIPPSELEQMSGEELDALLEVAEEFATRMQGRT